tara:strand:+ start:16 stop:237 length:222 start_codon:yes stop_codon:yes gene_type:complete
MPRRNHESLGDMISTIVFFGVSLTLLIASADSFLMDNYFKGFGFLVAGLMCFLGGLRYPIARFTDKLGWPTKK